MAYISILILILLGSINWYLEKKVYNPLTIFSFMWVIIIFLANLRLYGMYDFSNKPFILITIGVIGFSIGYWFIKYSIFNKYNLYKKESDSTSDKYDFNYKVIYIFEIICFLFYAWFSIQIIKKINSGISYSMIRSMYQGYSENALITSKLALQIQSWIAMPVIYLSIPVMLVMIFEKKGKKGIILLCILNIIMYIFCSASRFVMQYLIFESILLLFIYKKKVPDKVKKYIKRMIILATLMIVLMTIIRQQSSTTASDESVFKSLYAYICLCIPLFDKWINIIDAYHIQTFGMASISGFYAIINLFILKRIGIITPIYDYTYNIISSTETFMRVFQAKKYNAFVTMFFHLYLDFREIGVLLGSILCGGIYSISFSKVLKNRNILNLIIFLLLSQSLIKSMVRLEFTMTGYLVSFFYSLLFVKKNIRASNNKKII